MAACRDIQILSPYSLGIVLPRRYALRMRRRLFYGLAFVSAFCLLGVLVAWPVSYYCPAYAAYGFRKYEPGCCLGYQSGRAYVVDGSTMFPTGRVFIKAGETYPVYDSPWSYFTWNTPSGTDETGEIMYTSLGVLWDCSRAPLPPMDYAYLYIPFSYLAILFSILPALAFRSYRRRPQGRQRGALPKMLLRPPRARRRRHMPGVRHGHSAATEGHVYVGVGTGRFE